MKKITCFVGFLLLQTLLACKDTDASFSPGAGDSRITGTWRLVERRFQKDSAFSVLTEVNGTRPDSVLVKGSNPPEYKDTVIAVRDTVFVRRDTSFYTTRRYPAAPPQTLTFGTDGQLSAEGTEMSYYYPIKYFRVDSTAGEGQSPFLGVSLFISTNRANVAFRQGVAFRRDTLELLPRCETERCYLRFVRVR